MRKFADLHLKPPSLVDLEQTRSLIDKSAQLGFRMVGLSLPPTVENNEVKRLRTICHEAGVDLATRVDLTPKSRRELLDGLRRLRRRFELVSVFCTSKVVARQAAKDRRVDLLSFPYTNSRRVIFDRAEAELASSALACLEIDLTPLLSLKGFPRIHLLSLLRREVAMAKRLKVPVVLSSGAAHVRFLRRPQDLAFLGALFDLDLPLALEALSDTPFKIVERNRQKLSPDFVTLGVRVVRRRDCCPVG